MHKFSNPAYHRGNLSRQIVTSGHRATSCNPQIQALMLTSVEIKLHKSTEKIILPNLLLFYNILRRYATVFIFGRVFLTIQIMFDQSQDFSKLSEIGSLTVELIFHAPKEVSRGIVSNQFSTSYHRSAELTVTRRLYEESAWLTPPGVLQF